MTEPQTRFRRGPYRVSWLVDNDTRWHVAHGQTPRLACAQMRRLRRDYWLCGKDPGWITPRERVKWTRLARRVGLERRSNG